MQCIFFNLLSVEVKGELLFSSVGPVKLIHGHWLRSSSTMIHILAQYRFEGMFGFVCGGFSKKYLLILFHILVLFSPKHTILETFLLIQTPKTCKKTILAKQMKNLVKNTFVIWVWKNLKDWAAQNNYLKKKHFIQKWYIAMKHLDPCFETTFIKSKYLEVLLAKSGVYKSSFTLNLMLS